MKTSLIVVGSAIVVALLVVAFLVLHHSTPKTPSSPSFPTSTDQTSGVSGPTGTGSLVIAGTNGQTYTVPDFTKGLKGSTLTSGTYYQLTDNIETEGDAAQFEIQYGTDNSIQIALVKEPLGAARLAAEAKLRTFFPLTDAELCTLNVSIEVPVSVNNVYAGNNLGLSFCPGAVALP